MGIIRDFKTAHPRWPHLPAGPWRFKGTSREVFQAVPGDANCPLQPGACCDHCATGIYQVCWFEGAEGETFKVGSSCVESMFAEMKASGSVPSNSVKAAIRAVKDFKNAQARERSAKKRAGAADKAAAVKAEAAAMIESKGAAASALPHPKEWAAAKGLSLLDWARWMLDNGGARAHGEVISTLANV